MRDLQELGVILLIIVAVISGVQWFLLRFTDWWVALLVTGIIAFIITFCYVALEHATPNGGSNGPPVSAYITPTLIIFSSLLLGMWLVAYLTKNQLPKMVFIVPLCFMFVFAIGRNVYQYVSSATFYFTNFSTCKIEVLDEAGGSSNVDVILFKNSSSGYTTNIRTASKEVFYPQMIRFADKITFYYPPKNKERPKKEFSFDYSLFKEEKGPTVGYCFWLRSHKTLPMKIVLLPDDKVDLYLGGNLVKQYNLNDREKTVSQ